MLSRLMAYLIIGIVSQNQEKGTQKLSEKQPMSFELFCNLCKYNMYCSLDPEIISKIHFSCWSGA